uniref:Uncharacterized protein n=1 Tax=Fagus sylvatica TaxID=28930 RepID=A0A2N9J5W0_FAGSY
MRSRHFRRRVTCVVMRLVGVLETSFRQIFVFNEKASLWAASDTCHCATGRCVRGVFSFAKNGLGPPPIEGFVSPDSLLHRLLAELYSVIYPSIRTWEAIRGRMTANEAEWSLPLSEELPEGLSDESAGRVAREVSFEATPSTSGSRQLPRVDRSWKALFFFSKIRQDDIDRIRRRYQIPDDVVLRIPDPDERACCPKYEGDVVFYEADLSFLVQLFVRELLDFLSLAPGQVNSNGWRTIISCMIMWRVNSNEEEDLTMDEFLFYYEPVQIALSQGFWTFKNRDANSRGYRKKILGTSLESVGLGGPPRRLERILRILDIEDHLYNIFIEPDLLATFSLGPVPSSSVRALVKANKKRVDTMKLNKNRLKQLAQSGEVAAAPVSLKRKKVDEGSSKRVEEAPSHPSIPTAVPSVEKVPTVVMVDSDLTPPDEYTVAHTEDLSYLMVHSLMWGLTEAMVMGQRCASVEEDLAALRAKSMVDEAEMKNAKRAVMELTRERKDALAEVEKLKKELKARDDDVKAAVDAKDKAVADLKHLVGQIEGAKEAAVSEFRASEVFEDINTYYFLFGFEAFRKQAVQRFPGLDFSTLQSYDDEDSVVDASQDQAGDEDVSSK